MKQFIFLLTLCLIPFLANAQVGGSGNPTDNHTIQSYGLNAGTSGNYSVYMGTEAGMSSGNDGNTFIGYRAGWQNTSGRQNAYLGRQAGLNSNGSNNTYLGVNAGLLNAEGKRNVFIGWNAGYFETGNDKLIIDSRTTGNDKHTPLIYGDFEKNYVGIAINTNPDPTIGDIVLDASGNSPYGLYVGKGILTEKVRVAFINTPNWSDYVFEEDYELNTIEEVEDFIKENKHLPNVPSAEEVGENGVDVVEMDATLLRQIEELWLHVIELKKENEALKEEVAACNTSKDNIEMEATEEISSEEFEALKLHMLRLNERIQDLETQLDK